MLARYAAENCDSYQRVQQKHLAYLLRTTSTEALPFFTGAIADLRPQASSHPGQAKDLQVQPLIYFIHMAHIPHGSAIPLLQIRQFDLSDEFVGIWLVEGFDYTRMSCTMGVPMATSLAKRVILIVAQ